MKVDDCEKAIYDFEKRDFLPIGPTLSENYILAVTFLMSKCDIGCLKVQNYIKYEFSLNNITD